MNFDGGDITGDAGLLLPQQVDHKLGALSDIAQLLPDDRAPVRIEHTVLELFAAARGEYRDKVTGSG